MTLLLLPDIASGKTLRDYTGKSVVFKSPPGTGARIEITIDIPKDIDVPASGGLDRVTVDFLCGGDMKKGNVATSITRAPR